MSKEEVEINEAWTITPDIAGYILCKYGTVDRVNSDGSKPKNYGKRVVKERTYPSNIKKALKIIMESEARQHLDNLNEFKRKMDDVEANFDKFLKAYKANVKPQKDSN
jgi:uncharacterized protein YeaO (DUF488 family)